MSSIRLHKSFWTARIASSLSRDYFPKLNSEIHCEVCVVGGGITGVTLAALLAKDGVDVVLLEADEIGAGTTGDSSAHLDPLTDMSLRELLERFGEETAKKVLRSNFEAMDLIESNARFYAPDCEYEKVPGAFLAYTTNQVRELEGELAAAVKLGLEARLERKSSQPFPCKARLVFNKHARIDPLKYVFGLAKAAKVDGARIFQKSRVIDVDEGEVELKDGKVKAKQVVLATHIPIGLHPVLQSRVFAFRSYMIGARVEGEVEDALFWDMESPYHYIRKSRDEKGELLLIGGSDHRTGQGSANSFEDLRHFAQERFRIRSFDYQWSSQFYKSADGLPYIGKVFGNDNLYIATGFEGNGLTFGTVAARLLKDLLLEESNSYAEIFDPYRLNLGASGKKIVEEGLSAAKEFIKGRIGKSMRSPFDLSPGEGDVVYYEGEQLACYKDETGDLYALSPVCTHAKCHVRWNQAESSWDCPCHGGRYSATGEVIYGPPTEDLKRIDLFVDRPKQGRDEGEDIEPPLNI